MTNQRTSVIVAGGGPTGLMLAAELKLAGVAVTLVERRGNEDLLGSRAGGLHARSLEVLDQRGVVERFLAEGKVAPLPGFASAPLDLSDFPSRHNYVLALWQKHIERLLAGWVDELGVEVLRACELGGFSQDADGVEVTLLDPSGVRQARASYLVGCDGGRSFVRKQAGIEFAGWDASTSWLIAEASMRGELPVGIRHGARGIHGLGKLDDAGHVRVVLCEPELRPGDAPTLEELRAALVAAFGADFGVHDVTWLSRFTDVTRQASSYRAGRVLLAGDAAHVHSPAGGQGLNLGLQDAVNLGWKLAQVVKGVSPDELLDTYQAERHPVAARALKMTMSLTALNRGDDRTTALREAMVELLKMDEPRKRYAGMMSGLDVHYDLGPGHPLLGRRMPELDLVTSDGPRRVFSLLNAARPLLLTFEESVPAALDGWTDRVARVEARYEGAWELPVLGAIEAPAAVLVRPDGHVAWVSDGEGRVEGLRAALGRWFGPPSPR